LDLAGDAVLTLNNNTFADNTNRAIWVFGLGATVTFNNNVVWANGLGVETNAAIGGNGCNISQDGVGGVMADPGFTTTVRGGYRLGANSAAIDECSSGTSRDLDNVGRPKDGNGVVDVGEYDMGAFECAGGTAIAQTMSVTQVGNDVKVSWAGGSPQDSFYIYRDTVPHFYPTNGNLIANTGDTSYVDVGVVGNAGINYYYHLISAICANTTTATNNVAEFDFTIVPGTP
jgi:hypothetical protein